MSTSFYSSSSEQSLQDGHVLHCLYNFSPTKRVLKFVGGSYHMLFSHLDMPTKSFLIYMADGPSTFYVVSLLVEGE